MLGHVSNTGVSLMSLTMPISRSRSDRLFNSRIQFGSLKLFPRDVSKKLHFFSFKKAKVRPAFDTINFKTKKEDKKISTNLASALSSD